MKRSFRLSNLKPFSINAAYCTQGQSRIKSKAYRDWQCEVFFQLNQEQVAETLKELREYFEPEKHHVHVELTAIYPKTKFFTRKGTVSAKTQDLSNWEKTIIDCVFLPKHHETPVPYGAPNLNFDDKYVTRCVSQKVPSDEEEFAIEMEIEIKSLCP